MDFSGLLGDGAVAVGCGFAAALVVSALAPAGRRLGPGLAGALIAALIGGGTSLGMRTMAPRAEARDLELETADGVALKRYYPADFAILANVQRQAVADGKTSLERYNARRGVMHDVMLRQAALADDASVMAALRFTIKAAGEMERSAPGHCVEFLGRPGDRAMSFDDEDVLPANLVEEGREATAQMLQQTATHPLASPPLKDFRDVGMALEERAARAAGKDAVRQLTSASPNAIEGPAQCRFEVAFLKEMGALSPTRRLGFFKALAAAGS